MHFISDLSTAYHSNITTLQVDPKNPKAGAFVMDGDQLKSEIYYIPEEPLESDPAEFPCIHNSFKNTIMYQLLLNAGMMFDSLVHFKNDHYVWASPKQVNMGFWRHEVINTLSAPPPKQPIGS